MSCQSPCPTCGGNVNYVVPQPCSQQPAEPAPETPEQCSKQWLEVSQDFNWPGIGDTVTLRACCAEGVAPGAVLYGLGVGYLHVESIPSECEVVAKNFGEVCNQKVPGEPVAAGIKLLVGVPPCSPSGGGTGQASNVCLESSFLVPEVCSSPAENGACCVDVQVSSVAGLEIGNRMAIGIREFRLSEIKSPTVIRICNDGGGGLPGALVAAGDCFVIIDAGSPCAKDPVEDGVLMVCKNGEQRPVVPGFDRAIMQYNSASGLWEPKSAPALPSCTSLGATFSIDSTNPPGTFYVIEVDDSSVAEAGDGVSINLPSGDLKEFTVHSIVDGTHIRVVPAFSFSGVLTFNEGASVCDVTVTDICLRASQTMPGGGSRGILACLAGVATPITAEWGKNLVVNGGSLNPYWAMDQQPLREFIYDTPQPLYNRSGATSSYSQNVVLADYNTFKNNSARNKIYAVLRGSLFGAANPFFGSVQQLIAYANSIEIGRATPTLDIAANASQTDGVSFGDVSIPLTSDTLALQVQTSAAIDGHVFVISLVGFKY